MRKDLMTSGEKEIYRGIPISEIRQVEKLYSSGCSVQGIIQVLPHIEAGKIEFICQFVERSVL